MTDYSITKEDLIAIEESAKEVNEKLSERCILGYNLSEFNTAEGLSFICDKISDILQCMQENEGRPKDRTAVIPTFIKTCFYLKDN